MQQKLYKDIGFAYSMADLKENNLAESYIYLEELSTRLRKHLAEDKINYLEDKFKEVCRLALLNCCLKFTLDKKIILGACEVMCALAISYFNLKNSALPPCKVIIQEDLQSKSRSLAHSIILINCNPKEEGYTGKSILVIDPLKSRFFFLKGNEQVIEKTYNSLPTIFKSLHPSTAARYGLCELYTSESLKTSSNSADSLTDEALKLLTKKEKEFLDKKNILISEIIENSAKVFQILETEPWQFVYLQENS